MKSFRIENKTFLESLPDSVAEKLLSAANLIKYDNGQLINSRDEEKPGLSIVAHGAAHVSIYGENGGFLLTAILGPGEIFGEFTIFAELPRTHDIYAAKDTQIYQLSAPVFMRFYEQEPVISRAMLKTILVRSFLLHEILDALRRLPIKQRTAKVLMTMLQVSEEPNRIQCRQSELANTLGVSRVSVGKALKHLQAEGLLELHYREISIPDLDRLEQWLAQSRN